MGKFEREKIIFVDLAVSVNDYSVNFGWGIYYNYYTCSYTKMQVFFLFKVTIFLFIFQLIDALESHVSTMRATLRRKLIKEGVHSSLIPRAASMAVEVSRLFMFTNHLHVYPFGVRDFWLLLNTLTAKKITISVPVMLYA